MEYENGILGDEVLGINLDAHRYVDAPPVQASSGITVDYSHSHIHYYDFIKMKKCNIKSIKHRRSNCRCNHTTQDHLQRILPQGQLVHLCSHFLLGHKRMLFLNEELISSHSSAHYLHTNYCISMLGGRGTPYFRRGRAFF